MKKAFGQTVRDLKREVNKKVLKVPSIEQKVLDATSNEPWGPHGTVLADIAQASRNYHEYQIIMAVIWKRVNDTGKNWRHVYKALTVLEYMVANGSERVIDDIREHAYQIQTLSDFQYIDSNGRDQGNNVRKKSQSLVVLVNDKERIVEVRQKAAANREKYRGSNSGSMYRPGSGGYEDERYDGHYGSRDEDRNGHGRERESGYRDDDRYGREYEDRYSRDGYKDDDYRGRSRSVDGHQYGSRSRSSEGDRDRASEDDGQYTSRSAAMADSNSQDGSNLEKRLDRKFSEQNIGAPPSYEDAVGAARSPTYSEQGVEIPSASAPTSYSSAANASPTQAAHDSASQPAFASPSATSPPPPPVSDQKEPDSFDEFDPRGSFSAAPVASNVSSQNASSPGEMDLLGSLSESFSANSLALVPADSATSALGTEAYGDSAFVGTSSSSTFDDPFGDGPFKAIPSTDQLPAQNQNSISTSSYPAVSGQSHGPPQMVLQSQEAENNWGDAFPGAIFSPSSASGIQASVSNVQYSHQELSAPNHGIDILADILPPAAPQSVASSQTGFPLQNNQTASQTGNPSQTGQIVPHTGFPEGIGQSVIIESFPVQPGQSFLPEGLHSGHHVSQPNVYTQNATSTSFTALASQESHMGFSSQSGQPVSVTGSSFEMGSSQHGSFQDPSMQQNAPISGSYSPQLGSTASVSTGLPAQQHGSMGFFSPSSSVTSTPSQIIPFPQAQSNANFVSQAMVPASTGSLTSASRPAEDKFKTKSTVWTDTLNRGLVNLNISGPKTNPLSDIGVDFDAINRKEKRMEKPNTAPAVSNVTMGRAMGSGSGLGRSGAGVLRPPSNPMMGSGMGMGMGGGPRPGIGMGGYGAVNQPMGVGTGMNMQQQPMGMGMNMQQQPMGMGMNMQQHPMGMGMNMQQQPMGMGMNMQQQMGMGMNMQQPMGGMGMNIGIGQQGGQMQQPMGYPPGANTPGGYNSMMGTGNYGQQPYRGGYR